MKKKKKITVYEVSSFVEIGTSRRVADDVAVHLLQS